MATLAETFMDDLEDSEDDELEQIVENKPTVDEIVEDVELDEIEIEDISDMEDEDEAGPRVEMFSTLLTDEKLTSHLTKIESVMAKTKKRSISKGPLQLDEEHEIVVRSNELLIEIDHHIFLVHQFSNEIYSKKLPELSNIVPGQIDFAKCVMMIQNKSSEEMDQLPLKRVLTKKTALMVQVTSTTTLGRPLTEEELKRCLEGVEYMLRLDEVKQKIIEYINSRMELIAPNVSAVCGRDVAAQLISLAGGIEKLSTIPACNIQVLGANKTLTNTILAHHGVLVNCEILQQCPPDMKQRGLRLVANKTVLAARLDANLDLADDSHGKRWHEECMKKVRKWVEPPPQKPPKPLPLPEVKARKRGGKRYRRMREKYTPTETQRMANRMGFNVAEEEILTGDGELVGLGMLGQKNMIGGAIRTHAKPVGKSKLDKMNRRMLAKQRRVRSKLEKRNAQSGVTTSMVFTNVGGLEFEDPDNKELGPKRYFKKADSFAKKQM